MPTNANDIIAALPAARRRRIEKRAAQLIEEHLTLQELRKSQKLTQVTVARKLGIAQKQVSEIENRADMHVSTLRRTVEAMGGKLSVIAKFPNRSPVVLRGISSPERRRRLAS